MDKKYVVTKGFSVAGAEGIRRYNIGDTLQCISANIRDIQLRDTSGYVVVLNTIVSHDYVEKLGDDK
jgi:hypothetical protein